MCAGCLEPILTVPESACSRPACRARRNAQPAKVVGCLIVGLADDGRVQASADHASNISERNALVGDPVIPGSCGTLLGIDGCFVGCFCKGNQVFWFSISIARNKN